MRYRYLFLILFLFSCASNTFIKDNNTYPNDEITDRIIDIFPYLTVSTPYTIGHIHISDNYYLLPARAEALAIIEISKSSFDISKYVLDINDCDDFSLSASNTISKVMVELVRNLSFDGVLPIGVVSGLKYNNFSFHHSWNIFICVDTILFFDAASKIYWDASSLIDNIYFVWI